MVVFNLPSCLHRMGDSNNLTLEPYVEGCFCEKLSLYAGIEHARVVYAQPAKTLRLSGALGPLQEFGITCSMTWQIEAAAADRSVGILFGVKKLMGSMPAFPAPSAPTLHQFSTLKNPQTSVAASGP